jgi:hypothetical protein
MNKPSVVDERYYQAAKPNSLGERLTALARERIYADFLRLMQPAPADRILDVGVSDVINDAANVLERTYPHPERITAAGLGEGQGFRAAFPAVAYRQVLPNQGLPFADKSFEIAMSNAVLEHVGGAENRRFFVSELARVARRVFVTVPNRHFPVEHHTGIPLLHFWPKGFEIGCRALGKTEWLDPANLILLGRAELEAAAPPGRAIRTGHTGLLLGPFSSNLFMVVEAG